MICPMREPEPAKPGPPAVRRVLLEIDDDACNAISASVLAHHCLGIANSQPLQLASLILLAVLRGEQTLKIGLIHAEEEGNREQGTGNREEGQGDEDCPF